MDNQTNAADGEFAELTKLTQKINSVTLPQELKEKAQTMIHRAELSFKYHTQFSQFDAVAAYIDWITSLPWQYKTPDNLDIKNAKLILDKYHYGLGELKDRILEYLSVMKLNLNLSQIHPDAKHNFTRAPILFFVGLVGTGKTTMAISIAEALNRKFVRIPFGGMGSALDLRGESRVHPDAEVGQLIKALRRAGSKNPVILLDELDRVAEHARSDIMGVLVELLDPEQNVGFIDHYIDFPFDLSEVLFIATANNTNNISTAVMDRLEPIQMPSYNDEEKIVIAKSYVYPKILAATGLSAGQLQIEDNVWSAIVRPLGYDSGIRTLERTIDGVCRKVARQIIENQVSKVTLTNDNVKKFLPTW
ncbi:MAG: ATP-dependent protease La, ATP-dependent Lon protease [Candidatus Gottesmanbacteria bacterium GW2011_GWA2_43_14]|uniref:ATP-dependent protease La, ATP-dependent Lon protease n=1 Tax=Candidatus Gottesmanbacteria bacterium GW2011_GWA2_43_14 TaxID=1618443 RepID=A0A0G1DDM1_9BACT|nr:MAG: ATP-dependent protease La, ATP-dependent Lon protease [Candidatus Gottesmanbacteria bacterium GW2011_GWA2_43_14]